MKFRQIKEMVALWNMIADSPDLDPDERDAKLDIFSKLETLHKLYWEASHLAGERNLKRISRTILETFFEKPINSPFRKKFEPLDEEPDIEQWRPFLEPITNEQLWEWLDNPDEGKTILMFKIRWLENNLTRLKEASQGV